MKAHVVKLMDNAAASTKDESLVKLLVDVLDLHKKTNKGFSIVPLEKAMSRLSARSGKDFWQLVAFWEAFLQAHQRTDRLKSIVDNSIGKLLDQFRNGEDAMEGLANVLKDMPEEEMEKVTKLFKKMQGEDKVSAVKATDLPKPLLDAFESLRNEAENMQVSIFDRRK